MGRPVVEPDTSPESVCEALRFHYRYKMAGPETRRHCRPAENKLTPISAIPHAPTDGSLCTGNEQRPLDGVVRRPVIQQLPCGLPKAASRCVE